MPTRNMDKDFGNSRTSLSAKKKQREEMAKELEAKLKDKEK